MCDGPDRGYSPTDDRNDEDQEPPEMMQARLPMRVDPTDSSQNAFVQQWLGQWRDAHVNTRLIAEYHGLGPRHPLVTMLLNKAWGEIETAIEEIQGTYNFQNHERNSHTFTDKFPTIYEAKVNSQSDPSEEGYGYLRVEGFTNEGKKVWIEISLAR